MHNTCFFFFVSSSSLFPRDGNKDWLTRHGAKANVMKIFKSWDILVTQGESFLDIGYNIKEGHIFA